jgi:hypothetical protein
MKTKTTHTQQRIEAAAGTMQRIIKLMGFCSELAYCAFKYKRGVAYLHAYLGGENEGTRLLAGSKVYWAWFKNQWTLRDEAMLQDEAQLQQISIKVRRQFYVALHNPAMLAAEMAPNALIMRDSYAQMIGELHKNREEYATEKADNG